ncbi:pectate lyase [Paenibacillus barcinonensis]|uniref:Pectate lyase n=1 Tax=Paenibacillus barcinonensis TaxID=198119 RepID=A0A2V4VYX9_PAEBA|nr:PelA/Pel-15E family pectate lyase [Paenibacillus barcinonensis]QKS57438.1 pectate lyase [Paenibacillus barcinonensis]
MKRRVLPVPLRIVPVALTFAMITTGFTAPFAAASEAAASNSTSASGSASTPGNTYTQPVTIKTEVLPSTKPMSSSVDVSTLLQKFRDFSHFATGELAKDTAFALNIVSWQMPHGGFYKDMEKQYAAPWDGVTARSGWKDPNGVELGTFDNDATTSEIRFLTDMYVKTGNPVFKESVRKAIDFILVSQYPSGGWPQVYPKRSNYSDAVTYNDNAMVQTMILLDDITQRKHGFDNDILTSAERNKLKTALDHGIAYTLKAQIINNGIPTVWCAQHDPVTYEPLPGRAYELASKSGSESVAITAFLMSLPQTPEIERAAKGALKWFDTVRENGTKYNRQGPVYFEPNASSVIWYRFYNVDEDVPFYADRDGKKYMNILDISEERRHGYSWAGSYARNLLKLASDQGYYKLSQPLPK